MNNLEMFTSYTGSIITASVEGAVTGTLQGISYTVTRQMMPVYRDPYPFGHIDPRDYMGRNNRGIAGSIIMTTRCKDKLLRTPQTRDSRGIYSVADWNTFDVDILKLEGSVIKRMKVYGIEVLNEGSGTSIDDTTDEVQITYIARSITPWVDFNATGAHWVDDSDGGAIISGRELFEF